MRTTITLDEDVSKKLQAEMRRRRTSNFKETLNDVLRHGLLQPFQGAVAPALQEDWIQQSQRRRVAGTT